MKFLTVDRKQQLILGN